MDRRSSQNPEQDSLCGGSSDAQFPFDVERVYQKPKLSALWGVDLFQNSKATCFMDREFVQNATCQTSCGGAATRKVKSISSWLYQKVAPKIIWSVVFRSRNHKPEPSMDRRWTQSPIIPLYVRWTTDTNRHSFDRCLQPVNSRIDDATNSLPYIQMTGEIK
jgi:hypothetical protein